MKTLLLCLLTLVTLTACDGQARSGDPMNALSIVTKEGKQHDFVIEIADTPEGREKGLMHRTEMAKNVGMLFFFEDYVDRSFWMKNTLIPLDMIFIDENGLVTHIHDSAIPNDLTSVKSNGLARAVLELNGGIAKSLGIKAGDQIHHVLFGNDLG
jgi:uncharacterized membrane protein (UPF0127 family)